MLLRLALVACSAPTPPEPEPASRPTEAAPVDPEPVEAPRPVPDPAPAFDSANCLPGEEAVVTCTMPDRVASVCQAEGWRWPTYRIGPPGAPEHEFTSTDATAEVFRSHPHPHHPSVSVTEGPSETRFVTEGSGMELRILRDGEEVARFACAEKRVPILTMRRPVPPHLCPSDCALVYRAGASGRQVSLCDGEPALLVSEGVAELPARLELEPGALADPRTIEVEHGGATLLFEDTFYRGGRQARVLVDGTDLKLDGVFSKAPCSR